MVTEFRFNQIRGHQGLRLTEGVSAFEPSEAVTAEAARVRSLLLIHWSVLWFSYG